MLDSFLRLPIKPLRNDSSWFWINRERAKYTKTPIEMFAERIKSLIINWALGLKKTILK